MQRHPSQTKTPRSEQDDRGAGARSASDNEKVRLNVIIYILAENSRDSINN